MVHIKIGGAWGNMRPGLASAERQWCNKLHGLYISLARDVVALVFRRCPPGAVTGAVGANGLRQLRRDTEHARPGTPYA